MVFSIDKVLSLNSALIEFSSIVVVVAVAVVECSSCL